MDAVWRTRPHLLGPHCEAERPDVRGRDKRQSCCCSCCCAGLVLQLLLLQPMPLPPLLLLQGWLGCDWMGEGRRGLGGRDDRSATV